ncbi:MAG: sensor hybrid histidine kinase [Fibrobacteres bacterium]|nr:sensor hybrid histidine kinase [Fibrobacterota bacterium]
MASEKQEIPLPGFSDEANGRGQDSRFSQDRKLEAVGRLAAGVAHDFNNFLTAIIGYTNLALMKTDADGSVHGDLMQIREAGERAAALTQKLLAFSRRQMLAMTLVDLGVMARNMESLLGRLVGEDVEIVITGEEGLWSVKADLGQVEQIVLNLAINARDAMPEGGTLSVETRNVTLRETDPQPDPGMESGDYVLLRLSDTGCGMDASARSHLFEPFFTTKEPGMGAGLGLATVYGIVKQSGGYLVVDADPGCGSVFRIFLPAIRALPPEREKRSIPSIRAGDGGETILIVEDDNAVRGFLREALESQGYRVLEAANGMDAIELAAEAASRGATLPGNEGEIRMLVTDMVMAGLNGRELAEEVLGMLPGIKVLFISGYEDRAIVRHEVIGEGLDFLGKPFTPSELACKVRKILDGNPEATP